MIASIWRSSGTDEPMAFATRSSRALQMAVASISGMREPRPWDSLSIASLPACRSSSSASTDLDVIAPPFTSSRDSVFDSVPKRSFKTLVTLCVSHGPTGASHSMAKSYSRTVSRETFHPIGAALSRTSLDVSAAPFSSSNSFFRATSVLALSQKVVSPRSSFSAACAAITAASPRHAR